MQHPQNFQQFNPTDRQAHKYLCIQHPQNFQQFNPTDRYTSTCASNIRRTSNTSTGRHTSTWVANLSERWYNILCVAQHFQQQNFQHFNPTDRQAHKYLCGQHGQNFQHFNPIDRYTSTCASNIRRTSNISTQPIGRHTSTCVANIRRTSNTSTQSIGTQLPVHPTSAELPTLQYNR